MGNLVSLGSEAILEELVSDYLDRLYWPTIPYEGPVKLRFCCSKCEAESILLEPYPSFWKDLEHLKGYCFPCDAERKIYTKFVEAGGKREAIWTYNGQSKYQLNSQLQKFIRSGPPSRSQMMSELHDIQFTRTVRPENLRDNALPVDFIYEKSVYDLSLHKRHKVFLQTAKSNLKGWGDVKWWIIDIDRNNLLENACELFLNTPLNKMRCRKLLVKFKGEDAIDRGGASREFFNLVSNEILNPQHNLFLPVGPNNTFHPSPSSHVNEEHLDYFKFFGRFMGKALMSDYMINANLTRAIWKLLIGKALGFEDFQTVDRQTYLSLRRAMTYDAETLASCGFVFAVNIDDFGEGKEYELVEGGGKIDVDKSNLHEWIKLYSMWKMVDSVEPQLIALLEGFYDVVPIQLLGLFNELELEQLVCGLPKLDLDDWKTNTIHMNGNSKDDNTQKEWFWEIMENIFEDEQRVKLLQFVTGSARVPISFSYCNPQFTVVLNTNGFPADSLPYAHTCFNRLDLPHYTSLEAMLNGLIKALDFGLVGFGRK
eukprot:CAMPEP_0174252470 /NCGR_PEP_ID=MMETSP0439-20130205/1927_1 /TAXON_ID=0 /ORGANISM="Stereomyxa ramosa, Strain Chinc5" /LENGTH=539 /DNA_ID=CAMNT_0015333009 /DNA_START=135 /DNA_END=1754 /DNA_ORIENTATION=+